VVTRPLPDRSDAVHRGMRIHETQGDPIAFFSRLVRTRSYDTVLLVSMPDSWHLPAVAQMEAGTGPRVVLVPCINAQGFALLHENPLLRAAFESAMQRADHVVCSSRGGL
jgi:hypothetical protein